MKLNYDEILGLCKPLQDLKPTHCFDLLGVANKAWKQRGTKTVNAHYLADGLFCKIKDVDGQEYDVTIKPAKVEKK